MTPDQLLERLAFLDPGVDRAGHLRADSEQVAALRADARARVLPVWKQRHPFTVDADGRPQAVSLSASDLQDEAVFLGLADGTPWFAVALPDTEAPPEVGGEFRGLIDVVSLLPAADASRLAYARGMVIWHQNHLHCGRCGFPAAATEAGHNRTCTNPACGHRMFPRIDPAIITAIVHPDGEQLLLGRQKVWPPGVYSTIAGFVEPGETLEGAVAREAFEETGIEVGAVRYIASQPWPFPSSIMLGFRAQATSTAISRKDNELEDVRWFSRAEVRGAGARGDPGPGLKLSHPYSISRFLIDGWAFETP